MEGERKGGRSDVKEGGRQYKRRERDWEREHTSSSVSHNFEQYILSGAMPSLHTWESWALRLGSYVDITAFHTVTSDVSSLVPFALTQ